MCKCTQLPAHACLVALLAHAQRVVARGHAAAVRWDVVREAVGAHGISLKFILAKVMRTHRDSL